MNRDGTKVAPMIIENIEYPDNSNFTRKFELKTSPRLVMPAEMANGRIHMTSFFDLKEDGNLDLLVEYTPKGAKDQSTARKLDFIKCDDKGDTTFLKVQIFTNVCTNDCPTASSSELGMLEVKQWSLTVERCRKRNHVARSLCLLHNVRLLGKKSRFRAVSAAADFAAYALLTVRTLRTRTIAELRR